MKLTRRQDEFIQKMIELAHEFDGPIHYSVLADRLGVSPFTAYDMLCLLEEKGLVVSEYHLAPDKSGPGRAERVFCPTATAQTRHQCLMEKTGGVPLVGEDLRLLILDKQRKMGLPHQELAQEILARVPPDGPDQIRYCIEVMTIVALRLRRSSGRQVLLKYLPEILPGTAVSSKANLCMLGGFAFGILAQENTADREWTQKLLEHVMHYLDIVMELNPEDCNRLREYVMTAFTSLSKELLSS